MSSAFSTFPPSPSVPSSLLLPPPLSIEFLSFSFSLLLRCLKFLCPPSFLCLRPRFACIALPLCSLPLSSPPWFARAVAGSPLVCLSSFGSASSFTSAFRCSFPLPFLHPFAFLSSNRPFAIVVDSSSFAFRPPPLHCSVAPPLVLHGSWSSLCLRVLSYAILVLALFAHSFGMTESSSDSLLLVPLLGS